MKYLLDTNICIYLINSRSEKLVKKFRSCQPENLAVSAITVAELRFGADNSHAVQRNNLALDQFLIPLEIINFDDRAATSYGILRSELEKKGHPIGPLDTLIAAQAIAHDLVVVSNNMREFGRIKALKSENWT
jgi:tRNA(fMet)-specific endonuclease VapC